MTALTTVSETLYIPLLGRIYASRHHPDILCDEMALSISNELPKKAKTCRAKPNIPCLQAQSGQKTWIIICGTFYPIILMA